jgi:hypothetical protein
MSYWFGTAVGDLLFKGFTIKSTSGRCINILTSIAAGNLQEYSFAEVNQLYDDSERELSSHTYIYSCLGGVG